MSSSHADGALRAPAGLLSVTALQTILSRSALIPGALALCESESEENDVASGLEAFSFERWSKPNQHRPRRQVAKARASTVCFGRSPRSLQLEPIVSAPNLVMGEQAQQQQRAAPANQVASRHDDRYKPPVRHLNTKRLQARLHRISVKSEAISGKVQTEIEWIQSHFPVLKLATTKNSQRLRLQLLAKTVFEHVTRADVRNHWYHWKWTVATEKEFQLMQTRSMQKIIAFFHSISLGVLQTAVDRWKERSQEQQTQEQLAAAISIHQAYRSYVDARSAAIAAQATSLQEMLATMTMAARRIQRAFRMYLLIQHVRRGSRAVRAIQRALRRHRQRQEEELRRSLRQIAFEHMQQRERDHLQTIQSSHARVIQCSWRRFFMRLNDLAASVCVLNLVNQVEYLAAVQSIQAQFRGYFCRFHVKMRHKSCLRIQNSWRQYRSRVAARRDRSMLRLQQHLAASCLQRTFQRNRELAKFRVALQVSTEPLYLRARRRSDSFCATFYVSIAKSAAFVIQSTWKKHIRFVLWKQHRDCQAACLLQRALQTYAKAQKWHRLETQTMSLELQRRQSLHDAALLIQRRWKQRKKFRIQLEQSKLLVASLKAVICIQRHHQRRRDRWFAVYRYVHQELYPVRYNAAARIMKCWRRHQRQLQQEAESLNLLQVQQRLQTQKLQEQREDSAAKCIQRLMRRMIDKRNGRLLLRRYKILMKRELRLRQQRQIIHRFLVEQDQEMAKCKSAIARQQQQRTTATDATPTHSEATAQMTPLEQPQLVENPDVIQYWSEEHQRFYLYNKLTGESAWC